MGWMRFLNSDDVVAVLAISPFQDANAPTVRVAHGAQPCAQYPSCYIYGLSEIITIDPTEYLTHGHPQWAGCVF